MFQDVMDPKKSKLKKNGFVSIGDVGLQICLADVHTKSRLTGSLPEVPRAKAGDTYIRFGGGALDVTSVIANSVHDYRVMAVAKIGDDDVGFKLEETAVNSHVEPLFTTDPDLPSGVTVAIKMSGQEYTSVISSYGANSTLSGGEVDYPESVFHVDKRNIWVSDDLLVHTLDIFKESRENEVSTSLEVRSDPTWSGDPGPEKVAVVREMLPYVNFLFVGEKSVSLLGGSADIKDALNSVIGSMDPTAVVVLHRGTKGTSVFDSTVGKVIVPAKKADFANPIPMRSVYDGYFMARIFSGSDVAEAASYAAAASALKLSLHKEWYPLPEEVEEFAETANDLPTE